MHRDEHDDWLDDVLIERSSANTENEESIFQTASLVVDYFMSSNSYPSISFPLCRFFGDVDIDGEQPQWTEQLFAPLFGIDDTHEQTPSGIKPSTIKRTPKKGRRRANLKLTVAYRGLDFCGWEDQRHELYSQTKSTKPVMGHPSLPSVQGTLVDILDPILGDKARSKPIEIKVAGRTDRGVSAIGQVCRVRTWKEIDAIETHVKDLVNVDMIKNGVGLRIRDIECVGDDFHPSFGASCRAYAYLIDLEAEENVHKQQSNRPQVSLDLISKLDRMLRTLEGKELDYFALSHGKVKTQTTMCTLYRASVGVVEWSGDDAAQNKRKAICFELVGNRFLRRMVRILVATALREAHREDCCEDALLNILLSKDRKKRSRAAPPDGLIFICASF